MAPVRSCAAPPPERRALPSRLDAGRAIPASTSTVAAPGYVRFFVAGAPVPLLGCACLERASATLLRGAGPLCSIPGLVVDE
jgi:hypothetical protein